MKKIFTACILLLALYACQVSRHSGNGFIHSVNGKIPIEKLDFSLTHEHIMSNFGAEPGYLPKYDTTLLFKQVIPYLKKIKAMGVTTIFDCTTAYFGRDVKILKALADSTGLQIITNTGFYGAANDRYVPGLAHQKSEKEIAEQWIAEFENGIDQTGIRPGFIKLAFDAGTPSGIDIKLFKAGILTHLATGLTMAVHTGDNLQAADEQLAMLKHYKVDPANWIWVHANNVGDENSLIRAARQGAWISLDGVKTSNVDEYIRKLLFFKDRRLLHKILLSHDGNSFPRGGPIRKYEAIPAVLIPKLLQSGFTEDEINLLMVKNPQTAFKIQI